MHPKSILVNLIGGLGNQMFQWACGKAASLDAGLPLLAVVDGFQNYRLRKLELSDVFDLDLQPATPAQLRATVGWWRSPVFVRRGLEAIGLSALGGSAFVLERCLPTGQGPLSSRTLGTYLHGYWQSERWFAHRADAVRADFNWRHPLSAKSEDVARQIAQDGRAISLHVRRGDYVSNAKNHSIYAVCPTEYYEAAVRTLRQSVGPARVFAFSDDPKWVSLQLAPRLGDVTIVDHNQGSNSHQDMRLMSLCRHHVIANSSFSWWGAWLDPRADKQVIAPHRWYADGRNCDDLLPSSWHRI